LKICCPTQATSRKKVALAEAEEATKRMREQSAADLEKKALVDQLSKPSGVFEEEAIRRGIAIIERAVRNRNTQVLINRFPNSLCTHGGRAINQQEPGWKNTLTGLPKEIYELWSSTSARRATRCEPKSSTFRRACREMSASP
jgi:hypothetical protein